ncbi:uncharacterized protein Dana_GF22589 [Drosophila ananassae]|uniref:Uncharacterized protein n=1 Tax=Drosophila ananassae TaxID=7217 RepID=B3MVY7_DROAN|nr:uncharacterized protein LOC6505246 [Drosophila ananassae]XP_032307969.1 uncharacterized protein LOC6505246 [Drosophila ananassae]EDV35132.1 uncharacterized protein Dana_GF22589 [Drosophila ananassae]
MNNRGSALNTFSFWKGQPGLPVSYTPSIAGGMPMQTILQRPVPIVMPSLDLGVGDVPRTNSPPTSPGQQAALEPCLENGEFCACNEMDFSLGLAGVMSALRRAGVSLRSDRLGLHHSCHNVLNHDCSLGSTTALADSRQCHSHHEFRQQPGSSCFCSRSKDSPVTKMN